MDMVTRKTWSNSIEKYAFTSLKYVRVLSLVQNLISGKWHLRNAGAPGIFTKNLSDRFFGPPMIAGGNKGLQGMIAQKP